MNIFNRLFGKRAPVPIDIDAVMAKEITGSDPIGFGVKSCWVCVRKCDTKTLIQHLKPKYLDKVDWVEGLRSSYDDKIFLVDELEDWMLLTGIRLPSPRNDEGMNPIFRFLNDLSSTFGEAHFFASFRSVSAACWVKSVNGEIVRCYNISDGELHFDIGDKTPVEEKWALFSPDPEDEDLEEKELPIVYPGIEEVSEVAERWSINPMIIEEYKSLSGTGYVLIL